MTIPIHPPGFETGPPGIPAVHVAIVGGGIAGLAAAYALREAGLTVTVLEGSPRAGGKLSATEVAGVLVDEGAEALLARRAEGTALIASLGLSGGLRVPGTTSAGIWTRGALRPLPRRQFMGVPADFGELAATGLLSGAGLDRARLDAGRPAGEPEGWAGERDVSVTALVGGRMGQELVDRVVDPLLGGVYAGRCDDLSFQATLPALAAALPGSASLSAAAASLLPPPLTDAGIGAEGGGPAGAGTDSGRLAGAGGDARGLAGTGAEGGGPAGAGTGAGRQAGAGGDARGLAGVGAAARGRAGAGRAGAAAGTSGAAGDRPQATGAETKEEAGAQGAARPPLFVTLDGGLGSLPARLAAASGAEVRTRATVRELVRVGGRWRLTIGSAHAPQWLDADAVILALPARPASRLLSGAADSAGPGAASAAAALGEIEYASMAIVTLAYPADAFPAPPGGSGFLVPAVDGHAIKAVTFSTAKWPHLRAAAGPGASSGPAAGSGRDLHIVRCSVGRLGDVAILQREDGELAALAAADLAAATGVRGRPAAFRVTRWGGGLPQYSVGHLDRVARIRAGVAALPALAVCGAAYDGVGIPACIASANQAAAQVTAQLTANAISRSQD